MHGFVTAGTGFVFLQCVHDIGRALARQFGDTVGGIHIGVVGDAVTAKTGLGQNLAFGDVAVRAGGETQYEGS